MPNNCVSISQQWNTEGNQGKIYFRQYVLTNFNIFYSFTKKWLVENNHRDPYMLHRTQQISSTQDYHSVRKQAPAVGINNNYVTGVGRKTDGNEKNVFQQKGKLQE